MYTMDSKISFIIPAFNASDTIIESVESIIKGNFEDDDEIIIVNDGSTDNTNQKIAELKNKYPFIKIIINEDNKGCPASRNIGIKSATNPLIFNLDADDILVKKSVKVLKKYLIDNKADISAFNESRFFIKFKRNITHKWVYKSGLVTLADFLAGPIAPAGNFLYTKASWKKIGGYWEYGKGLHEFWGFNLKQLANGAKMVVLPGSYYLHRIGTGDSLFIRESKKRDVISSMATKMIMPFIDLLCDEDANYIKSEEGSKTWFDNFANRPLRLKTGENGITGTDLPSQRTLVLNKLKKIIPFTLYGKLKKVYFHFRF
jgi:glycosyltransferase involved in cell wall biosynthesis